MSTIYIVATPIGNLEDITIRALRVLKEVDMVLCEDTRVTRKLLDTYEIKTSVQSYHAHSTKGKTDQIVRLLESGKNLALVTDAGTPGVSDPGSELVRLVREQVPEVSIVPIPGASALTAVLSVAGISSDEFIFTGFVPHKKGRETFFKWLATEERAVIFYESVHRAMKTLESLSSCISETRRLVVAREITKLYEDIRIGSASEILTYYKDNPDRLRGEFVIVVDAMK